MSESVYVALITAGFTFLTLVVTTISAYFIKKLDSNQAERAEETKKEVKDVKNTLKDTNDCVQQDLGTIKSVTNSTHVLVNSQMSAQLLITATALKRISLFTKDPEDIKIAEQARKLYDDHMVSQTEADKNAH